MILSEMQESEQAILTMLACKYAIPSHWDIGKVYKRLINVADGGRLIKSVAEYEKTGVIDALLKVYN